MWHKASVAGKTFDITYVCTFVVQKAEFVKGL